MPLPLLIAGGVSLLASGVGLLDARGRVKTAKNIYQRHRDKYDNFLISYENWIKKVNEEFEKLGKRHFESHNTMRSAVVFIKKANLKERDLELRYEISPQILAAWEDSPIPALEVVDGIMKSIGAGTATAINAYIMVGALGTASTGTAIGSLSGVAAKNAIFAWLGGGSIAAGGGGVAVGTVVLGGIVVVPAAVVASITKHTQASKIVTELEEKKVEMEIDQAEKEIDIAVIKTALDRIDEVYNSIEETDSALQNLLKTCNPEILEHVYKVAHTAKSLGDLLDVAITDENGKLIIDRN